MKRQPAERDKIIVNYASDKSLIFWMYKEHKNKITNKVKVYVKDMNMYFSQDEMQMVSRHMKKMLMITNQDGKWKYKPPWGAILQTVWMAIIQTSYGKKWWLECGEVISTMWDVN